LSVQFISKPVTLDRALWNYPNFQTGYFGQSFVEDMWIVLNPLNFQSGTRNICLLVPLSMVKYYFQAIQMASIDYD
jgi:hypothetical protein